MTGALRDYSLAADSGNVMHRRFCAVCGTPLFSASEARPHVVFVRAGSLDDPEVAQPAVTIWTSAAPSWACFNERLPKVAAQPPPAAGAGGYFRPRVSRSCGAVSTCVRHRADVEFARPA